MRETLDVEPCTPGARRVGVVRIFGHRVRCELHHAVQCNRVLPDRPPRVEHVLILGFATRALLLRGERPGGRLAAGCRHSAPSRGGQMLEIHVQASRAAEYAAEQSSP